MHVFTIEAWDSMAAWEGYYDFMMAKVCGHVSFGSEAFVDSL